MPCVNVKYGSALKLSGTITSSGAIKNSSTRAQNAVNARRAARAPSGPSAPSADFAMRQPRRRRAMPTTRSNTT